MGNRGDFCSGGNLDHFVLLVNALNIEARKYIVKFLVKSVLSICSKGSENAPPPLCRYQAEGGSAFRDANEQIETSVKCSQCTCGYILS